MSWFLDGYDESELAPAEVITPARQPTPEELAARQAVAKAEADRLQKIEAAERAERAWENKVRRLGLRRLSVLHAPGGRKPSTQSELRAISKLGIRPDHPTMEHIAHVPPQGMAPAMTLRRQLYICQATGQPVKPYAGWVDEMGNVYSDTAVIAWCGYP